MMQEGQPYQKQETVQDVRLTANHEAAYLDIQVGPLALIVNGECHFCEEWPTLVVDVSQSEHVPQEVALIGFTLCEKDLLRAMALLAKE